MEYGWVKCCLIIFVLTPGYTSQCNDLDRECSCGGFDDTYNIRCPAVGDSAFILEIISGYIDHVQIKCQNSPKDRLTRYTIPFDDIGSIVIAGCPFNDTTLHEIFERWESYAKLKNFGLSGYTDLIVNRDRLKGLSALTHLSINDNVRTEIQAESFNELPQVIMIELKNNSLVRLPSKIFEGLSQLRSLSLDGNNLERLQPGVFSDLSRVEEFYISGNNLNVLPGEIFRPLRSLKRLYMNKNNFSSLPENLLSDNTELLVVDLSDNKQNLTTLPGSFLGNLPNLTNAFLHDNGLLFLPEDILWGASSLRELCLSGNSLTKLPQQIFKDLGYLQSLNLSDNNFSDFPAGLFAGLNQLEELNLSKNHLTTVSETLLSGLTSLSSLDVSENNLKSIHDNGLTFLHNLRSANFSFNQLTFDVGYGKLSPFHNCTRLESLYLDHNNITAVLDEWLGIAELRYLNLSYNQISLIDVEYMLNTHILHEVDLRYNNISKTTRQLHGTSNVEGMNYIRIYMEGNPIHCDYNAAEFQKNMTREISLPLPNYESFVIPGKLECKSPIWLQGKLVPSLKSSSLPYLMDNVECHNCCPEKCTCWRIESDQTFIVECSYRNLSEAPQRIVGLEGYHIVLNLTGNSLTQMPRVDRDEYENVTVMLLSHNNISRFDHSTLKLLNDSTSLTELTLDENPWKCDCDAFDFVAFLQTGPISITDLQNIKCGDTGKTLVNIDKSGLCPLNIGMIVGVSFTMAFLGLFIGTLAALYYKYKREVHVWLYAHQMCLWCVTEKDLDKDKLYDAFVSYSVKDEEFVIKEMVSELEDSSRPFKLCLHYRDWVAGEWIPTQIARSVEESRRTIIVLSPNFLESIWGRLEFRIAHQQALTDGRARVILVLIADIGPIDDLDPELTAYLKMNTYLKWGDRYFWDQLRYALPHPPRKKKQSGRQKKGIKVELENMSIYAQVPP